MLHLMDMWSTALNAKALHQLNDGVGTVEDDTGFSVGENINSCGACDVRCPNFVVDTCSLCLESWHPQCARTISLFMERDIMELEPIGVELPEVFKSNYPGARSLVCNL